MRIAMYLTAIIVGLGLGYAAVLTMGFLIIGLALLLGGGA